MPWTIAEITEIIPLTNTIVKLTLDPKTFFPYQAGQYLQMRAGDHCAYFSIANAPLGSKLYELHIRHEQNHASSQALLAYIQSQGQVEIQLPLGICHVGRFDPNRSLIFIAGGTGFAPIKAVIEYLLYTDDPRAFACYWMAKQASDLYWQDALENWRHHVPNFKHLALYSGQNLDTVLSDLQKQHASRLGEFQFMLAGAFEMVYACRDQLITWGVQKTDLFSDAFEFEK